MTNQRAANEVAAAQSIRPRHGEKGCPRDVTTPLGQSTDLPPVLANDRATSAFCTQKPSSEGERGGDASSLFAFPHWMVLARKMRSSPCHWPKRAPRPLIGPGRHDGRPRTALQTGRGTLSCVGCGHWTTADEITHISLIGREPPRGSSLNSAHHGLHGVGQSEVKVRVTLVLL